MDKTAVSGTVAGGSIPPRGTTIISTKPNYAFIDSQNLNLGVKSQGKKTYLFIGYVHGNQALYTYLQSKN